MICENPTTFQGLLRHSLFLSKLNGIACQDSSEGLKAKRDVIGESQFGHKKFTHLRIQGKAKSCAVLGGLLVSTLPGVLCIDTTLNLVQIQNGVDPKKVLSTPFQVVSRWSKQIIEST